MEKDRMRIRDLLLRINKNNQKPNKQRTIKGGIEVYCTDE